jgi:uncharacterized protein YkwD
MARACTILAATLTLLLAGSTGPLSSLAAASPRATVALTGKLHRHSARHSHKAHRARGSATRHHSGESATRGRHRTRGFRGVQLAPSSGLAPHATGVGSRSAAIAAVLATPCQNTELMPTPANVELVRAAVLCLINRERAQNGDAPLALSPQLQQAAQGHCDEMISGDYFEHVSPSGVTPVDRIRSDGYIPNKNVGYVIGENLAWGTLGLATPQAIVNAWIASPGHLANILETQYTETGIAVTPKVPPSLAGGEAGATYAQEFGVIVD